jgi:hypothetical protein
VSSTHLVLTTIFLLLSDSCGFVDVGRSLWREGGSVVYNCYWPSTAQSFSGLSQIRNGLRWRYSTPPPHGLPSKEFRVIYPRGGPQGKHFLKIRVYWPDTQQRTFLLWPIFACIAQQRAACQESVSVGMCLPSRCPAVDRYITICIHM